MPIHISSVRNNHGHAPKEILTLLQNIIKYSNNENNPVRSSSKNFIMVSSSTVTVIIILP